MPESFVNSSHLKSYIIIFDRLMEDFAPSSVSGNIKKLRVAMKKPDECKNVTCSKKKKL